MGLLEAYEENTRPSEARRLPAASAGEAYGPLVRLIMRLSGGAIADVRRAHGILLGIAVAACAAAALIIISQTRIAPVRQFSEDDMRRQLEEYKTFQPF